MLKLLRDNAYLLVGGLTAAGMFIAAHAFREALETVPSALLLAWLFGVILWGAFTVVHHSEVLAERLGEPYGTLVLTLSVTVIEVSIITAALLHADPADTLARDTVFAVVMITLNGIAGLCLLLGALRHGEQEYNLRGAQAFLSVIIPLTVLALVLPNFTVSTPGATLSRFQSGVLAALTVALYGVFLTIQTVHHRSFFEEAGTTGTASQSPSDEHRGAVQYQTWVHAVLLVLSLAPIIYLAEQLAALARQGVAAVGGPEAIVGVMIAVLVLSPEGLGAVNAALRNRLQRAINITLGSALATVSLTIPAVLVIGILSGRLVTLGLEAEEMVLLFLTIIAAMLTFGGARTNLLQGLVQLVLFAVFLALLFDP